MQNRTFELQPNTAFEKHVLANLEKINRRLKFENSTPQGEYLTPNEVCVIIKISKGKFYQLVRDGILNTIKPDPKGRKTYVMRSQVENLFPKDFNKN